MIAHLRCLLVTSALLALATGLAPAADRVAEPGDDLALHLQALESAGDGSTLRLSPGVYRLTAPLTLTDKHAGLTIAADGPEQTQLLGSVPATGWKLIAQDQRLWEAPFPAGVETVRGLFVNRERWPRCRTPNERWLETSEKLPISNPFLMTIPRDVFREDWASRGNVTVRLLQKWAGFHFPIRAVDAAAGKVQLHGLLPAHRQEKANRFWLENAAEFLDAPKEWFADPQAKTIRLIAPADFDPTAATITTPTLTALVRIENTRGVTLRGVKFAECSDDFPVDQGEVDPQAAISRRGAVRLIRAADCRLENCVIERVGGYAIDMGEGSVNCVVSRCELRELGAGGVRIGETNPNSAAVTGHVVEDCRVTQFGRLYPGACGLIVLHAADNRLRHNEVSAGHYTGVSVGWTWGYKESPCRGNIVEANHLHHLGSELMSDLGGVYLLGPQPGTVVRDNLIHDVDCHEYGAWGLYTDEGSTGMLLERNVVTRCRRAGFHQHYGRDNVIRSNLIVLCGEGGVRRSREEEHLSFTFEQNVVVNESPRFAHANFKNGKFLFRRNLYFSPQPGKATWGGKEWAQWQQAGQDAESQVADPLLADVAHPERGLQDNSPAKSIGFEMPRVVAGPRSAAGG